MNKYEAVCDFQFKESQIKDFFCPADKGLVEDIANKLDVGLVEFIEYESDQTEKRGIPEQHLVYYEAGDGYDDYEIVIGDRRVIGGNFYFRAYPKKGIKWSAEDEKAARAMEQLKNLRGTEVHTSVILSSVDTNTFRRLGVNLTSEPHYQTKKLYHR